MPFRTKRQLQKDKELLENETFDLKRQLEKQQRFSSLREQRLREEIAVAVTEKKAAQNGLTPYVYAVQALNAWLNERPALMSQVEAILDELGLLGVKVGYDPNKDLSLSIISPMHPAWTQPNDQ